MPRTSKTYALPANTVSPAVPLRTISSADFNLLTADLVTALNTAGPLKLSDFNATTSAELAGVISDETGSGALVFGTAPTLANPIVGTQSPGDNTTKAASTAFVQAALASPAIAHAASLSLGGSDATIVPPASNTYFLFLPTTIDWNVNSLWQSVAAAGISAALVAPAGASIISLTANIWVSSSGAVPGGGATIGGKWIKNSTANAPVFNARTIISGADVKFGFGKRDSYATGWAIDCTCLDNCTEGDYYNFYLWVDTPIQGTSSITINGNPAHSFIQGVIVA